jgi:hypothetical protein
MITLKRNILQKQNNITNNQTTTWEELSATQKTSIKLSIKQLENGEGISHEEVQAEMRKMLMKKS